ncbi:UDP-N-acetylmuramate dehydrogenase [bacterium]|nr:UDP-N-acetylmuramate dehydrogenase [bacterium]
MKRSSGKCRDRDAMTSMDLLNKMKQAVRGGILTREPLAGHTTWRIGGPADFYVSPKDLEDLRSVIDFSRQEGLRCFVIGRGSNLLVSDEGFRGIVLDLSEAFRHTAASGLRVTAGSGLLLGDLVDFCIRKRLKGIEKLAGIPGCVGGAIRMNAGAFGVEVADRLEWVRLVDFSGTLLQIHREQILMKYRFTDLPADAVIIEAEFRMERGDAGELARTREETLKKRREKQPLSLPSAGSVFKRPAGDYAGRLIEETGLKGLRIGDAMISKKHANFIVNCGFATAVDVLRLVEEVQERVHRMFQVDLELEIQLLGFDPS